ncbi:hypothetical protein IAD21_02500 [Abditibacteriota bacterium]|nr:hypothetical protein IAD21_02500 [Abditibacteriota bacterium]
MNLRIAPLLPHQIEAARGVVYRSLHEFFGDSEEFAVWQERVRKRDVARDIEDIERAYLDGGAFWVVLDGDEVVGTCAVRSLSATTCELKRMYLLPRVRGLGWGKNLAQTAIAWAREAGYTTMRLDTGHILTRAIALYRALGFHEIERYNDGPGELFFERTL